MKKLTFDEVWERFVEHNVENKVRHQFSDRDRLEAVIVFKSENWKDKEYSLEARSYKFVSDNKAFVQGQCSNSIFADSLDGSDLGIRLDHYLTFWDEDYCYIIGGDEDE